MPRNADRLIDNPPDRLRQRRRASGAWRVWWEPEAAVRALGFAPVTLDAARLTWTVREVGRLNAAVAAARSGGAVGSPGARTVAALVDAYRASPQWEALKPATRADYAKAFRPILAAWGARAVVDLAPGEILEWYEAAHHGRGAHQAVALVRKLSLLLAYARRRGWRADNPCAELGLATPPRRARVAAWGELDALLASADALGLPSMALAIALAVYQGQRQADLIAARRAAFGAGVWSFRRSKRGNVGAVPLHVDVLPRLEAMLASSPDRAALLHYEATDAPYSPDLFRRVWGRVRTAAGVDGLQFRDLRRTFGHLARTGGASERDVADALGNKAWTDPELSQVYMPASFETAGRAVAAVRRPAA